MAIFNFELDEQSHLVTVSLQSPRSGAVFPMRREAVEEFHRNESRNPLEAGLSFRSLAVSLDTLARSSRNPLEAGLSFRHLEGEWVYLEVVKVAIPSKRGCLSDSVAGIGYPIPASGRNPLEAGLSFRPRLHTSIQLQTNSSQSPRSGAVFPTYMEGDNPR